MRKKNIFNFKNVFIIAEAGVNHNGSLKLARRLVLAAKSAGADAVKFQIFSADKIVTKHAPKAKYQKLLTASQESQYEMLKKLELSEDQFRVLKQFCNDKKIKFLATPTDEQSLDFLVELKVPMIKIASGDITNLPFLQQVARKKISIILSTGMSTLEEVKEAVRAICVEGNKKIVLLHCVSNYPASVEDVNLKAMDTLRKVFNLPVGYSDHTLGIEVALAAVARGARVIEKHFTLDRGMAGPDHKASLEPSELKLMIQGIRNIEKALGEGVKRPVKNEKEIKKVARKSIVASKEIKKGQFLAENMFAIKRPGTGIEPKYFKDLIGREAACIIKPDEVLTWRKVKYVR